MIGQTHSGFVAIEKFIRRARADEVFQNLYLKLNWWPKGGDRRQYFEGPSGAVALKASQLRASGEVAHPDIHLIEAIEPTRRRQLPEERPCGIWRDHHSQLAFGKAGW